MEYKTNYRHFFLPQEISKSYRVSKSIKFLGDFEIDDKEEPVFIFSAGWRAGSTLLQRLVISSQEITVWGEPLGEAGLIPKLAYSLSAISKDWPGDLWQGMGKDLSALSNQWIANLTPEFKYLWLSHRQMILKWLKDSSIEEFGVKRWGMKEVRLTIDHARYLKWLFPKSKFLFIYRDPFRSYKSWKGTNWPGEFTAYNCYSPIIFAKHWRLLVKGYFEGYKEVDGLLVKFEDLVNGCISVEEISDHIGINNLSPKVLTKKIDSSAGLIKKEEINWVDKALINFICKKELKLAGYRKI